MDKIIKITLGAFIIILIGFTSVWFMNVYIGNAYLATLSGTFTYTTIVTTDSPLTNITLFIPVPEDRAGNSPIVSAFSAGTIAGIPDGWTSTLFYTGKTTLVKITASRLVPPAGTTTESPFSITLTVNTSSRNHLETRDPVENGIIFRPVRNLNGMTCPAPSPGSTGERCYDYETSVYADYLASPNASVTISSDLAGKNSWTIFEHHSNEYRSKIAVTMFGENHGWATAKCMLTDGIGMYDEPVVS